MPKSREEAARTLGAGPFTAFLRGTLPYLLPAMLQAASLIFLFCFFSFTIVLVFGGMSGSTLEVGIYRALRFTQDPPKALALALLQTLTAIGAVWAFSHFDGRANSGKGFGAAPERKKPGPATGLFILLYGAAVCVFFLGPLASLVVEAFTVRSSRAGAVVYGFDNFKRLLTGTGSSALGSPRLGALAKRLLLSRLAPLMASILGRIVDASRPRSWVSALPLSYPRHRFRRLGELAENKTRIPDSHRADSHRLALCRSIPRGGDEFPGQEQKRGCPNPWSQPPASPAPRRHPNHGSLGGLRFGFCLFLDHGRCQHTPSCRRKPGNPSPPSL